MLTIAHIIAAFTLTQNNKDSTSTILLFIVGIVGGQGSCIIFLSTLSTMLRYHSIICTSLVRNNFKISDTYSI
jgi:hypothetical protein